MENIIRNKMNKSLEAVHTHTLHSTKRMETIYSTRELQFKPQERNSILNIIELKDKIGRDRKIHLLFCVMQN